MSFPGHRNILPELWYWTVPQIIKNTPRGNRVRERGKMREKGERYKGKRGNMKKRERDKMTERGEEG